MNAEASKASVKILSFYTDLSIPQQEGTTVKLVANAVGGSKLNYKFFLYDGKEWKVLREYASDSTYTWTPIEQGSYKFRVHVKDENSSNNYDDYADLVYEIKSIPGRIKNLDTNIKSPQNVGSKILLTANAESKAELLYKFCIYNGKQWKVLQDYSTSKQYAWKPLHQGTYKLMVYVKSKYSKQEYDDYAFKWFSIQGNRPSLGNIVLLSYHGIKEKLESNKPWQLVRLKEDFENDMKAIKESGVSVKSYNEVIKSLKNGNPITEPTIIIQFDDGLLSDYQFAYPILKKFNLKATFFVTPGRADGPVHNYMSWSQIQEIYHYKNISGVRLFEIGGHGQTHTRLSKRTNENYEHWLSRLEFELEQPQREIEEHLGYKINLFALPFGAGFDTNEVKAISESLGYDLIRGWKQANNNFTYVNPNKIIFFPMYNNSSIQYAIDAAAKS